MSESRHLSKARNGFSLLGAASLFVMFALISPGVQVAQATESATISKTNLKDTQSPFALATQLADGKAGSCRVGDEGSGLPHADIVAGALADLAASAKDQDIVVFGGTGLNYASGDDPVAEMRRIRQEVRNERAAEAEPQR